MDRALMARLMTAPEPSSQSPLFYLLDMYGRASAELRSASSNRDAAVAQRLQDVACYAQELAISHANLALTMDVFPEVIPQPSLAAVLRSSREPESIHPSIVSVSSLLRTNALSFMQRLLFTGSQFPGAWCQADSRRP